MEFRSNISILIFFSILFVVSCSDPIGLEENLRKTLIDSVKKEPIPNKKFVQDSISIVIYENNNNTQFNRMQSVSWISKINYANCIIDTNGLNTSLSMNLDVENSYNSDSLIIFYEHIKAFQIKIDSLTSSGSYYLNGKLSSNKWSAIFLENSNKNLFSYEGSFSPLKLDFYEDVRTKKDGYIRLELRATFPNSIKSEQIDLSCSIFIHYKIE